MGRLQEHGPHVLLEAAIASVVCCGAAGFLPTYRVYLFVPSKEWQRWAWLILPAGKHFKRRTDTWDATVGHSGGVCSVVSALLILNVIFVRILCFVRGSREAAIRNSETNNFLRSVRWLLFAGAPVKRSRKTHSAMAGVAWLAGRTHSLGRQSLAFRLGFVIPRFHRETVEEYYGPYKQVWMSLLCLGMLDVVADDSLSRRMRGNFGCWACPGMRTASLCFPCCWRRSRG